jgi:hypothetical protein
MSRNDENTVMPPNAARLAVGMRDMGYSFESAISDLVDNSIAASATQISIFIDHIFPSQVRVAIVDNGSGMEYEALKDAMKYGASEKPGSTLNKFGLGLKTASSSFSKRFTVVSRTGKDAEVSRATWDIDSIVKVNDWVLESGTASKTLIELLEKGTLGSGTLVLWENIDRLLNEKQRANDRLARKAINKRVDDLLDHLGRVFQRYLDPISNGLSSTPIKISVNGTQVLAWDPFCVSEANTLKIYDNGLDIDLPNGKQGVVKVRGFVLPRKEEFSSIEARDSARVNNDNQGIYIYRQNRLIQGPDWQGIYRAEPHYSLARIDLSFDNDLDEIFGVDVEKSRIVLESDIKDFLEEKVFPQIRLAAVQRYRDGQLSGANTRSKSLHATANASIGSVESDLSEVKIISTDQDTGEAQVENKNGTATIRLLKPDESQPDKPYIVPLDSLRDGVFWEPVINENRRAVAISTSHPFYNRVYLPSKQKDVVIQSFDFLLWAIAMGEMNTINEKVKDFYQDLRINVSRQLRILSDDLPEADNDDVS